MNSNDKILVPKEVAKSFVETFHQNLIHPGQRTLWKNLKDLFSIDNLTKTILEVTFNCEICQTVKNYKALYDFSKFGIEAAQLLDLIFTDLVGPIETNEFQQENEKEKF